VGVYNTHDEARTVIRALETAGVQPRAISVLTGAVTEARALGKETGAAEDLEQLIQDHPLADLLNWLGRIEAWVVPGFGAVLGSGDLGADFARPDGKRGAVTGVLVGLGVQVDDASTLEQAVLDGKIVIVVHGNYPVDAARAVLCAPQADQA
jgi:hypothetical protein